MLDNDVGFDFQPNADLAGMSSGGMVPGGGQSIGTMGNVPNSDLLFSSNGGSL